VPILGQVSVLRRGRRAGRRCRWRMPRVRARRWAARACWWPPERCMRPGCVAGCSCRWCEVADHLDDV